MIGMPTVDYKLTQKKDFGVFAYLAQYQGGVELQTGGIRRYVEDLKPGPNAEIGPKDFFELASTDFLHSYWMQKNV